MPESPNVSPFSYAQLTPAVAELVRGKVEEIRRATGRILDAVLATGQALIAVKEALRHGQFGSWLCAEFSWSERTAQRYMSVTEAFGANPTLVSDLALPLVYDLAAPKNESARRELVGRAGRGDKPSEAEVRTIIGASRELRRIEREAAKERERRSQLSPTAKRSETAASKHAVRMQREKQRDRQTAQEATDLLLPLLPEAGLRQLASLFNEAGALPETEFRETFFDALKNRLFDLGWNGKATSRIIIVAPFWRTG
jgi:hypothetical protein